MIFGGGERKLPTQAEIESQVGGDFVSILAVSIDSAIADVAAEISATLQEHDGIAGKKIGKAIVVEEVCLRGNAGEDKESVGGDALQGIDLVTAVASAEFKFVAAVNPTERAGEVEGILISVARAGDGIADRSVASDLNEWRSRGGRQRGCVLKSERRGRLMIQMLVQQEDIAKERKARDADGGGRKDVSLLRDEVLRAVIFADGKSGDIGTDGRKRIGGGAAAIHVAEI